MKNSPFLKIVIIIVIALMIPALSYTVFQLVQQNRDEALIQSIYEQQLESVLFSVNQHCWDLFHSWAGVLQSLNEAAVENLFHEEELQSFIRRFDYIDAAFLRFYFGNLDLARKTQDGPEIGRPSRMAYLEKIELTIRDNRDEIDKSILRARKGYIQPITVPWEQNPGQMVTILIVPLLNSNDSSNATIAGIMISDKDFVDEVIAVKFNEMDEGNFTFAVGPDKDDIIYINEEEEPENYEKSEILWILPNLKLFIKLRGTTLAQLSQDRTRTNLFLLIGMNVFFLLGTVFLLRSIFSEMKLSKLKTDFMANISHELRTPLALIRMHAETLEMGRVPSEEKKQHYYKLIASESEQLTQIVNNILDFSKIESHKKEYHFVTSNLEQLVRQTLERYRFHLEQTDFLLDMKTSSEIPKLLIDESAINLALINLLDNAIKFSRDDKEITVMLARNSDSVFLSVQDRGIGIPKSEQKKIFEKFYRVDSLVHDTKGSGLGLSLVQHIMQIHSGKALVDSKPGGGSTFTLVFPVDN